MSDTNEFNQGNTETPPVEQEERQGLDMLENSVIKSVRHHYNKDSVVIMTQDGLSVEIWLDLIVEEGELVHSAIEIEITAKDGNALWHS